MARAFLLALAAFTALAVLAVGLAMPFSGASAGGPIPAGSDERLLFAFDPREVAGTVHFQTALRIAALRRDRNQAARVGEGIAALRDYDRRIARLEGRLKPHLLALEARLAGR